MYRYTMCRIPCYHVLLKYLYTTRCAPCLTARCAASYGRAAALQGAPPVSSLVAAAAALPAARRRRRAVAPVYIFTDSRAAQGTGVIDNKHCRAVGA